ncbi:hypothetical protein LBMAG52_20550 [Planctomycetia bacterium]|nr:hypothetical protein LBMAG52_20550 [Planctomycetia bacterium]
MTDVGLKKLAGLKNINDLELANTQVTDAGVMELKLAVPKCQITK